MYDFSYIIVKLFRKLFNGKAINHSSISKLAKCDIRCNVSYSKMGKYSYIGENTSLSYTQVGNFTSISSNCTIGGGSHPLNWVSTSPVFTNSRCILHKNFSNHSYDTHKLTKIGNDVWIGSDCLIKGGVEISDGAVIGMGSIVTHDVGPYEIWAGNPARMIKKRFDDKTIEKLMKIKWWNWNDEKISKEASLMNDINCFLENNY